MTLFRLVAISTMMAGFAASAMAQDVAVKNAWVRTSVPGQSATGAFMTITAKQDTRLVGIVTPVAGVAEVHEVKMDGSVMKMRAVEGGLVLPAGQPVELKPGGGYHVMLMDLKAALPKDSMVPMTLVLTDAKGLESRVELQVPVATGAMAHKH